MLEGGAKETLHAKNDGKQYVTEEVPRLAQPQKMGGTRGGVLLNLLRGKQI